jgi:hypothetical protein
MMSKLESTISNNLLILYTLDDFDSWYSNVKSYLRQKGLWLISDPNIFSTLVAKIATQTSLVTGGGGIIINANTAIKANPGQSNAIKFALKILDKSTKAASIKKVSNINIYRSASEKAQAVRYIQAALSPEIHKSMAHLMDPRELLKKLITEFKPDSDTCSLLLLHSPSYWVKGHFPTNHTCHQRVTHFHH